MKQFPVPDTLTNFVGWLNTYGEAHQPDFKPSGKPAKFLGSSKIMVIHHRVTVEPHGYVAGRIDFDILPVDAEFLEVTAETFSQMNIIGRTTPAGVENPYRDELDIYFAKLIAAIRERWKQVPQKPVKGAPVREWSKYRHELKQRNLPIPPYKQLAAESGHERTSIKTDYWEYQQEIGYQK